jgi:hypothetical protein
MIRAQPDSTSSTDDDAGERRSRARLALGEPRAALSAFVLVEIAAFAFYWVLVRGEWFFADEWDFIANRKLSPGRLLAPHYGHWSTLPILVYRLLWELVGLRSYLPYVTLTIALHLTAAALLRLVMRRAGIRPWIATLGASVFVLFGAGAQDIVWAFQIGFDGALVFGLVHVVLADHAGTVDRRDVIGLAAGALGLMCSGVGVAMVIVAGIAAGLRRDWRVAALHTLPLGVVFLVWWAHFLRPTSAWKRASGTTLGEVLSWSRTGALGLFSALGYVPPLGVALFAVLGAGSFLAWRQLGVTGMRERAAAPIALACGVPVFLAITGKNHGRLQQAAAVVQVHAPHLVTTTPRSSHYQHILAALLLPALTFAVDILARKGRMIGVLAIAVLLAGVPGNVIEASRLARGERSLTAGLRTTLLSVARDPLSAKDPPMLRPEPNVAGMVTLRWLRLGIASGRVPEPPALTPAQQRTNALRLSLMELDTAHGAHCRPLDRPTGLRLRNAQLLGIRGTVVVTLDASARAPRSQPVAFGTGLLNPSRSHTLVDVAGSLVLEVAPGGNDPELCGSGV